MKDILEKRIQELSATVKESGEKYNELQGEVSKLANDHNVAVIKLQEAQELLANAVKAELESNELV